MVLILCAAAYPVVQGAVAVAGTRGGRPAVSGRRAWSAFSMAVRARQPASSLAPPCAPARPRSTTPTSRRRFWAGTRASPRRRRCAAWLMASKTPCSNPQAMAPLPLAAALTAFGKAVGVAFSRRSWSASVRPPWAATSLSSGMPCQTPVSSHRVRSARRRPFLHFVSIDVK